MLSRVKAGFPFSLPILLLLFLSPIAVKAGTIITGTLGADSRDHFRGVGFAYNAGLFGTFDNMTLLGVQSGQGTVASGSAIPVFASAIVRLPIGRIVLPVAIGDIGYAFDSIHAGLVWRGGGGFDIRNGRRSSFLALGSYERQGSVAGWSGRFGILLEF